VYLLFNLLHNDHRQRMGSGPPFCSKTVEVVITRSLTDPNAK
jgi:hypothetical protein